ncbi:MAG: hypothetical protein HY744_08645 [Deltaproteobacteria bacterium]|nr:hypothetical protein [Deltaproteobacteria bacterium]
MRFRWRGQRCPGPPELLAAALAAALGCAGSPGPAARPDPPAAAPSSPLAARPPLAPTGAPSAGAGPRVQPAAASGAGASAGEQFPGSRFPPPGFEPMHARTAQPGDGVWAAVPEVPEAGGQAVYKSTLHPDPIKRWVFVDLVAFDRALVDLHLAAGTDEPESKSVPRERRTGLVPEQEWPDLLVVFNGGFKAEHGGYGMRLGDDRYVPPRDDACALVFHPGRRLRLASWMRLAAEEKDMLAYRQTPACLIEQGQLEPRLRTEFRTRRWGSAKGGALDIRRSAIGLDATGRTLFYAFGDWVSAKMLAEALARAGVADAAELDINWSFTHFFFFEHPPGAPPRIRSSLVSKAEYSADRYTTKPSARDFFYVVRRKQ